ncbi:MAG TPA: ATP-binding protein [Vicinamibacterales bacterium]|nr:ATP-binding protein [Vicinamibacterales bacterium]
MRTRLRAAASPKALAPGARSTSRPLAFKSDELRTVCATFGLSPFEGGLLLLCAAIELDSDVAALCARIDGREPGRASFALASRLFDDAHWSALLPTGPLRYWHLVEVDARREIGLAQARLSISERALHYLAGLVYLDESLHARLAAVPPPGDLWEVHATIATRIASHLDRQIDTAFALTGADVNARRSVVAHACAQAGVRLFSIRAEDVPSDPVERDRLVRGWSREALLAPAVLLIDGAVHPQTAALVDRLNTALVLSGDEGVQGGVKPLIRLHLPSPSARERRDWWQVALGQTSVAHNGTVDALAAQFALNPGQIAAAVKSAPGHTAEAIWDASRLQARPALGDLAQRIEPAATWHDLVLPPAQMNVLRQVAVHVRQRLVVYDDWGFGAATRGLGISALFAGVSGTGKTMAAEVLASELRLDLYRIDLSQVVSKYIGETEKNLRRVFDSAEGGGVILLFDEADALFGRRSEVKDSHDRYANIEVSYLLQRMETYRGLAILTTNQRAALDSAFLRRLRFVVEFPFPDAAGRAEIWRRAFPAATPTDGLDVAKLARLNVAGGNIRNIAVNAAFLAADAGRSVTPADVLSAARSEYSKMDKALADAEIRDWV